MKFGLAAVMFFWFGFYFAQGNLQFNQVLLLDGNTNTPTYTVPAGKVWKIESLTASSINGYLSLTINGSPSAVLQVINGGNNLPFWVPAGTVVGFYITNLGKVSILEFNIVP
jgi:hypothetical protein